MPDVIRADFVVPADRPAPAPADQPEQPAQGVGNVDRLVPDVLIKVNGAPLSKNLREAMHTVEVHQSLKVADMAVLTFDNPHNTVSDANEVNCGNEVEVELGYLGGRTALFKGEIISLEPNWPVNQSPSCVVRAYDKMHAMRRGRKQRTFTEQKVSDIVSSIASEEGLTPEVEDTAVVAKYIIQNNQSNVEILRELARRYQCEIKVDGVNKKLILRKPKSDQGEAKTLAWGKDLKSFYVKMSVANVATKVETKTWDVAQKQTVVSTVETQHGSLDVSPSILDLAKKFGEAKKQITNRPTSDPGEAQAMAASALNEGAMDGVTARATCLGDAELTPGAVVKLDGLGKSWTGKYYVTGATHLYHKGSGYSTEVELGRNGIGNTPVTQVVDPPTPPPAEGQPDPGAVETSVRFDDDPPDAAVGSPEPPAEEGEGEAPPEPEPAAEENAPEPPDAGPAAGVESEAEVCEPEGEAEAPADGEVCEPEQTQSTPGYELERAQWRDTQGYCGSNARLEAVIVGYPPSGSAATVEIFNARTNASIVTINTTVDGGRIDVTWASKAPTAEWRTDRIKFRVSALGLTGESTNEFTFRARPTTEWERKDVNHTPNNGFAPVVELHDARLDADRVRYSQKYKALGDPFDDTKKAAAKSSIENVWNNGFSNKKFHRVGCVRGRTCNCTFDCCKVGFRLDINWVTSGEHIPITIHHQPGTVDERYRSSMGRTGDWGDPPKAASTYPHEAGHSLGQFDEYTAGGTDPSGVQPSSSPTPNLMATTGNTTLLARHYRRALAFLNGKTGGDVYETIPPTP